MCKQIHSPFRIFVRFIIFEKTKNKNQKPYRVCIYVFNKMIRVALDERTFKFYTNQ